MDVCAGGGECRRTDNAAERALRHGVIWRRTSGGTDSAAGSQFVGQLLSGGDVPSAGSAGAGLPDRVLRGEFPRATGSLAAKLSG